MKKITLIIGLIIFPLAGYAFDFNLDAMQVNPSDNGGQTYSLNIQLLALMTALTFIPAILLMMTSFTRIVIVLSILRQALGMPQTPSNQIIIALSLFLSLFIMSPILNSIYTTALKPYNDKQITQSEALQKGLLPIREFMYSQTRKDDLNLFTELANSKFDDSNAQSIPFSVLVSAFITSELKTAFQIGFIIFIPFLIIDLVVASVLMSMGMMMLSPLIISLPFKIMLFVLIDGWNLVLGTLASSFL